MLIRAYTVGIFPMAGHRYDPDVQWVAPTLRGILPLDDFHVPRRLRRTVRQGRLELRCNSAFADVMEACAEPRHACGDTWINPEIIRVFCELHDMGFAHSVETWLDGDLVGGLYGLALGGAFFGESMFSRVDDSSKVALVALVALLRKAGFGLLDAQFINDHLQQFGAIEITAADYMQRLDEALQRRVAFPGGMSSEGVAELAAAFVSQSSIHRS